MTSSQSVPLPGAPGLFRRGLLPTRKQLFLVLGLALLAAFGLIPITVNPFIELFGETLFVGLVLLFAFTLAGAWRQTWLPRWVVQVVAVAIAAIVAPLIVQMFTVGGNFSVFISSRPLVRGYFIVTFGATIFGSLFALGALVREREAQARAAALQFALERETLQRQAADARLKLLTAQIEPHFLLNTLANVQALVESGSERAAPVFRSLVSYLRAAMPQLQQENATLGDEERLVRAYLDLMLMRMPDRLQFSLQIDPALRSERFPPMALLTLVENAIRHGVDPACDGASIEVGARRRADAALNLWVADTGVGMSETAARGTGLRNLEARLQAFFGARARLELSEQAPHGLRADIVLPAHA